MSLVASIALGQLPGQFPGSSAGPMEMNSVYNPYGPQSAFGPGDSIHGPDGQLPFANGEQQPGELQNLSLSQSMGQYGNLQLYGSPNAESQGAGASFQANPATWVHVRDLQMGVYTNDEQTVINGGSTFEFYVDDRFGLAGRVLLGGANNESVQDEFHFSGDLYAGTTIIGEHWIKGGVLYDVQDEFHKVGPALGALLFVDRKHPVSLDVAYGLGYGSPVIDRVQSTLLAVADDDVQLRAGTYVTPNLQVGFSGNWLNWADGRFEDYNGYGGFVNLNYGLLNVMVDVTDGDGQTRGFVNVGYTFGGRRERSQHGERPLLVEHPRDWLGKPVIRDVSLQLQRVGVPASSLPPLPTPPVVVGNITQVNTIVQFPGIQTVDQNGNGIADASDQFELNIQAVNGTSNVANGVSFGQNATVIGPATMVGLAGVTAGNVAPGQVAQTNGLQDVCVAINATAQPGQQIFVDFDVMSDGQSRRFRSGPFVVGQIRQTGVPSAALGR